MALPRVQTLILTKLCELGHLQRSEADRLLKEPRQKMSGKVLEKRLREDYKVGSFELLMAKARAFKMNPFIGGRYRVDERVFDVIDEHFCVENEVIPVGVVGGKIVIATSNPFDLHLVRQVEAVAKMAAVVLLAQEEMVEEILTRFRKTQEAQESSGDFGDALEAIEDEYSLSIGEAGSDVQSFEDEKSAPVIQLANRIVEEAYYAGASDIHIEPDEKECRIRVRIDGLCSERLTLPRQLGVVLATRFKVMANLDIAEKRLPQDGRIVFKNYTKKSIDVDLRVATSPLNHGEGLVMRILDKQKSTLPMEDLGYEKHNLERYQEVIKRPYGMVLHCGPTGSGKSMTLYSALNYINSPEKVIRTAEDPIEYTQPGLCQMQMHPKIGLTFARALRAFLRQDPDIILVGEIRDLETASIAVEASLTGHLLFSTLHTNDAAGTIIRLTEMGIEPFMISASLICVCAQRLMRRLCSACRSSYEIEGRELEIMKEAIDWTGQIYGANKDGCSRCNRSGYKGRIGIHELMVMDEALMEGVNKRKDTQELKEIARAAGMKTLHQDSMYKVKAGLSSMEEAISIVPPDFERFAVAK